MGGRESRALQAVVRGRVQGVGFRAFVVREAEQFGLTGWVRNLRDGGVEVWAEGPAEDLERLLEALGRGPSLARVTGVQADWRPAGGKHEGFHVAW
ncbi:MAG: acylphosphatase [Candidatus Sumerlaeia bacterium]|nr:acylphosphatase [Candidatus Sumerlaeia bacterium]